MLARSTLLASLLSLTLAGCGGGPALRAAESGDLEAARRALAADAERGAIGESEAKSIAREVLKLEVKGAKGESGVSKLRELSSCAEGIDDALDARGSQADEIGAIATMIRFDARLLDVGDLAEAARGALSSKGAAPAWRAVEARGLVTPEDAAKRRSLFTDGDEAVRVAALRASFDSFDPSDLEALLEAARLDPHPPAREIAIDAVGSVGGERGVLALRDLFVQASEDEQLAIVGAWASARSIDAGGLGQIVRTAETSRGLPQLAAAAVLMRRTGPDADNGTGVIARAIASGSTRERTFAIEASTLSSPSVRDALVKAQSDTDEDVALAALRRSLELYPASGEGARPKERAEITNKLMAIAKGKTVRSLLARAALARAGVREVLPLLKEDARSDSDQARKSAGTSLIALGELGPAAVLTVDKNERVRRGVACAMLRSAKN